MSVCPIESAEISCKMFFTLFLSLHHTHFLLSFSLTNTTSFLSFYPTYFLFTLSLAHFSSLLLSFLSLTHFLSYTHLSLSLSLSLSLKFKQFVDSWSISLLHYIPVTPTHIALSCHAWGFTNISSPPPPLSLSLSLSFSISSPSQRISWR